MASGPHEPPAEGARDLIYDGVLNAALLERLVLTLDLAQVRAWASWREGGTDGPR